MSNLELIKACTSCTTTLYQKAVRDNYGRVLDLKNQFDTVKIQGTKLDRFVLSIHFNIIGSESEGTNIFNSDIKELSIETWIKKCDEDENRRLSCPLHETVIKLNDYYNYDGFPKFKEHNLLVNMEEGIDFGPLGEENILGEYVIFCKIRDNNDRESENYIIKGVTNLNLV